MKKLLLLAAVLSIGTAITAAPISDGVSYKGGVVAPNHYSGDAGGLGTLKDVTTNDKTTHNNKTGNSRVNILRDKGAGWEDSAQTKVILEVIQPIRIKSESNRIFTESVKGDELQIGDIGFTVTGSRDAVVTFEFKDKLFEEVPGEARVRGLDASFFPIATAQLGNGAKTLQEDVSLLSNIDHKMEVDLYFDLKNVKPGIKRGTIVAKAMYK